MSLEALLNPLEEQDIIEECSDMDIFDAVIRDTEGKETSGMDDEEVAAKFSTNSHRGTSCCVNAATLSLTDGQTFCARAGGSTNLFQNAN
jgi:hypothetical protein